MAEATRSKSKKRSGILAALLAPFRVLRKAGEFYMKFVEDCSDMVGNDYNGMVGGPAAQMSTLPKSYSVSSSKEGSIGYSASGRRSGLLASASGRRSGPLASASGKRTSAALESASGRRSSTDVLSESASGKRSHEILPANMRNRESEAIGRNGGMGINPDGRGIRSYSVGIGKIGKIDEESACSFREDDGNNKTETCPRSRSQAVTRRYAFH